MKIIVSIFLLFIMSCNSSENGLSDELNNELDRLVADGEKAKRNLARDSSLGEHNYKMRIILLKSGYSKKEVEMIIDSTNDAMYYDTVGKPYYDKEVVQWYKRYKESKNNHK